MMRTLSKKKINMIEGSLWDKLLIFALPLAATGILQQLFNAADIAVVGRFTGEMGSVAMAAVGANTPIVNLVVNFFVGMALGTNVVIAKATGMKDTDTVRKAVHTSISFAVIAGICGIVLGEIFAVRILTLIKVPEEVLPLAVMYLRIYIAGLPVILLYNYEAAIFRAVGDTRTPLMVLAVSGIINVALNVLFVVVIGRNVDGVALATVISNLISSCLLFISLLRAKSDIKVIPGELRINRKIFFSILNIGVPAGIQSAIFSFANIIIQSAINSLGTIVMAASSAAFNIEIFAFFIMNSFGQACTTFVGQNFGAGQPERCRKTLAICICECAVCLGTAITVILLLGRQILSVFNTDPGVIETGYIRLIFIFSAYTFSMFYENIAGYLRGFGLSLPPAVLTMLGVCGVRIFWIYVVFPKSPTFKTIMTVYPVSLAMAAFLLLIALLVIRPTKRRFT